jgi:putative thioredoxin
MSATLQHVVDVTDSTFEQVVVEGSKERPVVVDLWATWCGPCHALSPILEKEAEDRDGAFLLAKLDVDENPMVAGALGVQSIPMVIAFRDGRPVNGFVGAYPEQEVRQFVDTILPTEADVAAAAAQAEETAGDLDGAERGYRDVLADDPGNRDAALGLARILLDRGSSEEARSLASPHRPDPEAERLLARLDVQGWSGGDTGPGPLGDAKRLAADGRTREALDAMLEALVEDRDAAREAMVTLLASLGDDDPLVPEYRRKLASALF